MYINSNHIRITKLLQNIPNPDFQFFTEILKTSEQNINLYIKDIYKFIYPNNTTFKKNIMLDAIKEHSNLIPLLKKNQEITKEERITFIIFSLLLKREVNLSELSDFLSVTRRSLNYDILEIKEQFYKFNLEILSLNSKGVKIIGHEDSILRILHTYIFKILIEIEELPEKLQKVYKDFLDSKNYYAILKDVKFLISKMSLNKYFHINNIFSTFFISFMPSQLNGATLKDLTSSEKLYLYFKDHFSFEETEVFFNSIHDTILEEFPLEKIHILILFLKLCNGSLYLEDQEVLEKSSNLINFLEKKLALTFNDTREYMFYIRRIAFFSLRGHPVNVKDFSFLSLNLGNNLNKELIELFLDMRKNLENVNFSEVLNLYFYLTDIREHREKSSLNTYLLYKDIPEQMFENIQNRLSKIYSIDLIDFVDIQNVDYHLENFKTDCFIVLEKLNYINSEVEVRHLPFPL